MKIDITRHSLLVLALLGIAAACGDSTQAAATSATKPGAKAPASASKPRALRFTGIPNDNTTELKAKYTPLAEHLAKQLAIQVEYVPSADYTASVDGFKNGDIHLCWFGGLTGLQARQAVPGARVIACGKIDKQFHSYFVANKSLGLGKSDEFPMALKGKKFTFGSMSSTSGRLMPEYFIRKLAGQSPRDFFGAEMMFSGSHDKTAKLVEAGTFDAGAMDYATYDRMVREKKLDPDVCRIVWVSPDYPDYHFCVHPSVDSLFGAGFTDKLQKVLVGIQDPALLAGMNRPEGLIPATNEDFDTLRTAAIDAGVMR